MSRPVPGTLRRRSDRLRTAVGWILVAAALCLVVAAWAAALSTYRDGLHRIQRDAATRATVVGTLLDDATPAGTAPVRPVRVSYVDPLGRPHVGQLPVTGRLLAGTPVRVEVDADGRIGVAPPSEGDALLAAATVATGVLVSGALLLLLTWVGVRTAITARNHAAWEREWRRIEPQWSGRGRRV